jgi:ribose/xylose/arabinose/galactoside ABC-type transport system permease subunit
MAVMAFVIRSEAEATKFRTELFSVLLLGALLMATWAVVGLYFEQRRFPDAAPDRLGRLLAIVGFVLATLGIVVRLLFTTDSELPTLVGQTQFRISILWFIIAAGVATWILARTRFGSWTFAVGGSKSASRQVGVPAARTKTQLFMIVSGAAWLVGMLLAFRLNTIQASTGDGKEFEYIIAAVVGGCLLTGGYGSALGAAIGAIIMAMSFQGIPFAGWNSDWRFVFLGAILLLAVMANNYIRKTAEEAS